MYRERIYVCHTYYHVYITLLKEFALPVEKQGKATLVLSKMSTDFGGLKQRIEANGVFEQVLEYDEKPFTFFEELQKYKVDNANPIKQLWNRIIFTKKFAKLQEAYVPTDFTQYKDIYVYCDSDPIGYYLNYKKIKYHAVEDGLNCLVHYDTARYDNRGNFKLKAFLAKCNLIFIQNGYSKYCVDMEVNSIADIRYTLPNYIEVPRKELELRLTEKEKELITNIFVENLAEIKRILNGLDKAKKNFILLTEPLCSLDIRKQIFKDLIDEYCVNGNVVIKPHPRDELDYTEIFKDHLIFEKMLPMEVLNLLGENSFDLAISVLTEIKGIRFAKESVRLGPDFMDKYEEPSVHRQNEQI